jgi:hypothetical protein
MSESEFNSHRAVRKALERAADLLMDHGIIRTGHELEQVCEQIRNLAPPSRPGVIQVMISQIAIMVSNAPRDTVIGLLRDKGIPARPGPGKDPMRFSTSIQVDRGWLECIVDARSGNYLFRWEEDGVPF